MRKRILTILWICLLMMIGMFSACLNKAQEHRQASNGNFDVQLLFTVDGVRVYRFLDGHAHYFAVAGRDATAFSTESCGKNCTQEVAIQTVRR